MAEPTTTDVTSPHITAVDHVAIAVNDLPGAVALYADAFGASVAHRERVDSDQVEEVLLRVGESYVQLLSPTAPTSPVARFLEKRGEGIHHVAYRVDDCAAALRRAVASGAVAIDEAPRPGSRHTMVAFIHPRSALGTLVELVEEPNGSPNGGTAQR
jgi:methylmalonyl-CoA/ethylmalonyl-CoA epimerase